MKIYLEITNNCNKKCEFCAQTKRSKGFVSAANFRDRVKKIVDYADEVYLHVLGEPLLHKNILEVFSILNEYKLNFKITSNGTLLSNEKVDALLENPFFKQINFSLHALNDEEINSKVLAEILEFSKLLLEKRSDVFINFRLWNYSTDDAQKNVLILDKVAQFFELPKIKIPQNRRSKKLYKNLYLNIDSRFDWPINVAENSHGGIVKGFCHGGSSQLGVLLDGTVVPCCLDSEGVINLGNIDQIDDFLAIINSPRLKNICKNFSKNTVIEPFCQKCTFRKRFSRY